MAGSMDHGKSAAWVSGVSQTVPGNTNQPGCFTVLLGREKSCFHSAFIRQLSFAMEPGLVAREISGKGSNHAEEQQCQRCLRYTWIDSDRWILPHKKKYFRFHICFQCSEAFAIRMSIFKNVTCPKQCVTEPRFLTIRSVAWTERDPPT